MQLERPMDDEKKVTHIDSRRIRKLESNGHYYSLLEEFDLLRSKLIYNYSMDKKEAHRLVTLIKYFLKNGHNEAFKLQVQYLHDKYIKDFKL